MANAYPNQPPSKPSRFTTSVALALSLSLSASALAAPGDTNSTNTGGTVAAGTYYNTADGKTTFVNNGGTGDLHLPSGQTVRGLEVTPWGSPTGNGGTLHFYAPGGLVRLDGNVDVSAILSGKGAYMGNGGRVFVDAAMLYQNGTVFANGINGGAVQFNVGAAMFGPASVVQANGFGGTAGTISVNSSGIVDLQKGAIFDASGRSINTQNAAGNVNVNIVGSLVNNEGIITANGIAITDGHVALLATEKDLAAAESTIAANLDTPWPSTEGTGTNGGVIRLVSTGQTRTDCADCVTDKAVKEGTLTTDEAAEIKARHDALVDQHDGDIINTGTIQANGANGQSNTPVIIEDEKIAVLHAEDWGNDSISGSTTDGGNGGVIIATAARDISNNGLIQANGGNGGDRYQSESESPSLLTKTRDDSAISLAGKGGDGGVISLSATGTITNGTGAACKTNPATIEANGGNGGSHFATAYASDYESHSSGAQNLVVGPPSHFNAKPAAEAALKNALKDMDLEDSQLTANAYADNSRYAGGQGGKGGAIGISYGKQLVNNGTISAEGGNGGNGPSADASSYSYTNQSTQLTAYYKEQPNKPKGGNDNFIIKSISTDVYTEDAHAYATAKGGRGGDGGNGGLVVLSGPANPTGNGIISVNGGKGGNGGSASASATAKAPNAYAYAEAKAYGGSAGQGGKAGWIVAPSTSPTFNYTAKDGRSGLAGEAHANAYAEGKTGRWFDSEYAKAYAKGNDLSTADATARHNWDDTDIIWPTYDGTNNGLIQTQNNEILIHGNTVILMTKGGYQTYLTDRISNAFTTSSVRSVDTPFGNVYKYAPIRHFVIASNNYKPDSLILNKPEGYFDNLTSMTVLSNGSLVQIPCGTLWSTGIVSSDGVNLASGGGHLSIVAPKADIINGGYLIAGGINTGGSITLAGNTVKNGIDNGECKSCAGSIITGSTNPGYFSAYARSYYPEYLGFGGHGGSTILKGLTAVENLAVNNNSTSSIISSGVLTPTYLFDSVRFTSSLIGGTIRLQSLDGVVFNEGAIMANGLLQGGSIITKAYTAAVNNGIVEAKATGLSNGPIYVLARRDDDYDYENEDEWTPSLSGAGGFIRWHGNGLSLNNFGAVMDVTGPDQGGVIQLTAGGPTTLDPLTLPSIANGLGITQGTLPPTDNGSLITSAINLPLGSAVSAGYLDARATNKTGTTGKIDVAGDGLAGLEANSVVNGVTVGTNASSFFSNPAIAGHVQLTAGSGAVKAIVCGGETPKNPDKPSTPPRPEQPATPMVEQPNAPFRFEIGGALFQYFRPELWKGQVNHKLVLRLSQPGSFLSKAYAPVTQEILNLALKEYNRELAFGKTVDRATESASLFLLNSGIDPDTAVKLVAAIQAGNFTTDTPVLAALQQLGKQSGTVIRQ